MSKLSHKISVIGSGTWGSALALHLGRKGYNVHLWARKNEHIQEMEVSRENARYLKGFVFPENVQFQKDLRKCVQLSDTIVIVVPSHGFRKVFSEMIPYMQNGCRVVSAIKGIENDSLKSISQIAVEMLDKVSEYYKIGVLSGPSFAEEVARAIPTAVTIGFSDLKTAEDVQRIFATDSFRVYASTDVIGLEISAALKNIIAIAAGVCDGLGYGLNTRAALITRGLAEIKRFGLKMGAQAETFSGLSGMGDLILTCTGDLSRNRRVGIELGKGKKLKTIQSEMRNVAEGVKTTKSVFHLSQKLKIEMPILREVYEILYKQKNCSLAVKDLLTREMKVENEGHLF